jgi:hypothetical protein
VGITDLESSLAQRVQSIGGGRCIAHGHASDTLPAAACA